MNEKKNDILKKFLNSLVLPVAAIVFALFISIFFVMWAKGIGFFNATGMFFSSIWRGSFGTRFNLLETLVFTIPLLFTGLAHAIAFKTGLFNIGVEGQYIVGMLTSALVGLIPGIPRIIHVPLVLLAGTFAGVIWASIPGYLKAKIGTNEVVNTIMMNFIAMYISNYLVMGPFRSQGTASTSKIAKSAALTRLFSSRLNTGIFIGIAVIFIIYFILWKTTIGYELRAVGLNPDAAEYGGISIKKNIILAMAISGAIAGLGGAIHVAGIQNQHYQLFGFPGYGFDGITVALVAKSNPIGVIFSAVLFGALGYSSAGLQIVGIPSQIAHLIQGIVILFVAAEYLFKLIGLKRKKEAVLNE